MGVEILNDEEIRNKIEIFKKSDNVPGFYAWLDNVTQGDTVLRVKILNIAKEYGLSGFVAG